MTLRQQHDSSLDGAPGETAGDKRPHISVGGRRVPVPRSRLARILAGGILIVLGFLGFLPVLGFWMIPVGLLVLSYDFAVVRRARRRIEVWWHRRRQKTREDRT